jgi:ankyrin repeat protein
MTLDAHITSGDTVAALESVSAGADLNQRADDGFTPLLRAAARGDATLVIALLEHGADIHALDPRMGTSALHLSAQSGRGEVTATLLAHGAFIDLQSPALGNTALMDAVLYRSDEVARVLLDHGARTFIRNHWHQSALELARDEARPHVARWIEERDRADADARRAAALVTAADAGDAEEMRRRLEAGAAVDERSPVTGRVDDDYTALGIAASDGRVDLVEKLLAAGADPREPNGLMGGTALHEAAYFGHADVIAAIAASGNRPERLPAELDTRGAYNGLTALHDAVWHGHEAAARALVEAGARTDIRTHAGLTPRELAVRYGYRTLAAYLTDAEAG